MPGLAVASERAWGGPRVLEHPHLAPGGLGAAAVALLLGVPFPANLLVLAAVAAFVVALVVPTWGLGLVVASIPLHALETSQLGAIEVAPTKAILAGVAGAWVVGLPLRRHALNAGGTRIAICFGVYVLVVALSVVNVRSVSAWSGEFYRWWSALALFVVAASVLRTPRAARPVLIGMAVGVAGTAVVGLYQVVAGTGPDAFDLGGITRAYGPFGHPNPFAGYLGVTVPQLAAVAGGAVVGDRAPTTGRALGRGVPIVCGVAAAAGFVALLFTQSRGGWLGAVVGLGAVVWLLGGRVRWTALVIGGLLTIISLATPVGERVANRVATGAIELGPEVRVTAENFAVHERLAHWRTGVAMAREYPGFGVGAGNFSTRYREFTPVWRFRVPRGHAHNAYIQAAAQTGLVGLAAYLGLLAAVGTALAGALRRAGAGAARPLVVGAIGVSLAFAAHNLVDYMHVLGLNLQLSVVWALASTASSDATDGTVESKAGTEATDVWSGIPS